MGVDIDQSYSLYFHNNMEVSRLRTDRKFSDSLCNNYNLLPRKTTSCCCAYKCPVILSYFENGNTSVTEDICDRMLTCRIRSHEDNSIQPFSAKTLSAIDLYAHVVAHQCLFTFCKLPLKNCSCCVYDNHCSHPIPLGDIKFNNFSMQFDMPVVGTSNVLFPRKCFSLPHYYKHHIALGYGLTHDYKYPRDIKKEKFFDKLSFTSLAQKIVQPQSCYSFRLSKKNSPSEFKMKLDIMKRWFGEFSDEQKNNTLKSILDQCGVAQTHLLSLQMATALHYHCPKNCEDPLSWLPQNIALYILSFMDPVSLCKCSQVCRTWNELANEPVFWQYFCQLSKWQLSRVGEQKQMIAFRLTDGQFDWKKAFSERYRLNRNWLKGYCHVRTFHGHTQGVFCVQFDDTRIVSGSSDKTIKVWNIRTNSPWSVMTLVGHSGTVRCLHLDGNRLVSGSSDCSIKVWDLSTQQSWSSIACKVTMIGHSDTVRCLQVDDEKVVSGSYDCSLKVWDIKTGLCKATLRGHEGAVLCLQFDDVKIVSGSGDKTIKIWRLPEGHCVLTLAGHEDAVTCLQFDISKIISGSLDRTIKFWNLKDGSCLSTLDWMKSEGHTGVVRCLQADRWRIVSAGDDKTLKVWNLETGKRLVTLRNHSDGVTCLQFNDSVIVSGSYDQTVKLWDFSVC